MALVRPMPLAVRLFGWVTLGLTLLCLGVEWICGTVLRLQYPYTWPLMPTNDPFRDFHLYRDRFSVYHSAQFFTYPGEAYLYPAPAAVFYKLFFLSRHPTRTFLLSFLVAAIVLAIVFARKLLSRGISFDGVSGLVAATVFCSYPFFFDFEQGNIEWIIWLLVLFGVWAFVSGRGSMAAVCFGFAASIKFYPILFVCLFLSRRQFRQASLAVVVSLASTVVSLWLLCPDIGVAWRGTLAGIATFRERYMLDSREVGFDHSLFALPKAFAGSIRFLTHSAEPPRPEILAKMLTVYSASLVVVGLVLYVAVIRRLPWINQIICLTVATVLLPPVSYDYTLLYLYVPWAVLVLFAVDAGRPNVPGLMGAMVCFAILFAPETELIVHGSSLGGQLKAVTLMVLAGIALLRPFRLADDAVDERLD